MPCHCGARQCGAAPCCDCCFLLNKFGERCARWDCPCCYDDPKKDFNPDVNPGGFCQRDDLPTPCGKCLPCVVKKELAAQISCQ